MTDDKVFVTEEEDRHEYRVGLLRKGHGEYWLVMPTSLQQTDLNAPESNPFRYHHHTGLCTNIWI